MKLEIFWQQLIEQGLEHLILEQGDVIRAEGLAVGTIRNTAYRIKYQVVCDRDWNTQRVQVEELIRNKKVVLIKSQNSNWADENDSVVESLKYCTDVDIMVTPFTNTLPIRRLNLAAGASREIAVVYISVPDLTVSRFEQRYTCLSKEKDGEVYRYESLSSEFTSDLKVDTDGLVVDYPEIFRLTRKQVIAS